MNLLLVAIGGAIGASFRYLSSIGFKNFFPNLVSLYPNINTLTVNLVGSFFIGFITHVIIANYTDNQSLRLFLIVGFLGGFTTFSSFSMETINDILNEEYLKSFIHVLLNVLGCLVMTFGGLKLAKYLF